MEINCFSHEHPLVLVDPVTGDEGFKDYCSGCHEVVEGSCYNCGKCGVFLHKKCAELPREINHPLHHLHPLVLSKLPYGSFGGFCCHICRKGNGFSYNCSSCNFDLDLRCAMCPQFVKGDFQKLQHFSHDHPLIFVEDIDFHDHPLIFVEDIDFARTIVCSGCQRPMSSPFYCCLDCTFYLHKKCAELPLDISHPSHRKHPLFLLAKPRLHQEKCSCFFCISDGGFVYYCSLCEFGIRVKDTFSHEHLLLLVEDISDESGQANCSRCRDPIQGSRYSCEKCSFFLHKKCFELQLEINHPLHLQHPLILYDDQVPLPINHFRFCCNVCMKKTGSTYRCTSCDFNLDISCAAHPKLIAGDFQKLQHFSHCHPLIFVEDIDFDDVCSGCQKPMSSPFYCCPYCKFYLHKKCTELPLEINHPCHRKHSLLLLPNPPPHQEECSCHWCEESYRGFVYYCSLCEFGFKATDAFLETIIAKTHEHPLNPISATISFTCNACGIDGKQFCFTCTKCSLIVHTDCISVQRTIKITRHRHRLSHIYFLREKETRRRECNICHDEVNVEYGSYFCSDCNYFAHVNCAIDKYLLEEDKEEGEVEDENQLSNDLSDISCAFRGIKLGEIKHFAHEHNLIFSDHGAEDGKNCEACMRSISTSFYYCAQYVTFAVFGAAGLATAVMLVRAPCAFIVMKFLTLVLLGDMSTPFTSTTNTREGPFVKLGLPVRYDRPHSHSVTLVRIDFNPPSCNECGKHCRDLALQCVQSNCRYIRHFKCTSTRYVVINT
ncbi:hypothetical protein SLEP1_g10442 [Rubroshorea leprosula]|uniref:Phorbol-ester/DAG-type domain-containing protein n=1 Tax=Rubroshorea leprosula TaxID=152421 RepID=A0AAV5IHZ9_9ROSI|nr:hypothetical protein SLEP1_g10442 [Rubroshorea leprosula]